MADFALGLPLKGEALTLALIRALAAIQEEAVGTAAGNRATVIGDPLVIVLNEQPAGGTEYRAEVRQTTNPGEITIHLEAV